MRIQFTKLTLCFGWYWNSFSFIVW